MNQMQLSILSIVGVLVLIIVGYLWYQEIKFKKMVAKNFDYKIDDTINEEKILFMEGAAEKENDTKDIFKKDIINQNTEIANLFNDSNVQNNDTSNTESIETFPEDSMEAIFAKFNKIPFPFEKVDLNLDYLINAVFEESIKIKIFPNISSLTQKKFKIFILDNNNVWFEYRKGDKYIINGFKLIVHLVDKHGIINKAQINMIYKEIFKFVMQYHGYIEQSDFDNSISKIKSQINYLPHLKLELELYLILKNKINYTNLASFLIASKFTKIEGRFHYLQDGITQFMITDENDIGLEENHDYSLLKIVSNLHFIHNPTMVVEKILDFSEHFTHSFESRLLTRNKQLFTDKEYRSLLRYVEDYANSAKKHGIELGGELVHRLF